jgi:glycine cleavage system H lipoate-binding protein
VFGLVENEKGGGTYTYLVGITEFIQSDLGEIAYVDLPSIGAHFNKEMKCLVL